MAFMMNKLAMINSFEIILEIFFAKNHCEIQVRKPPLYSIKYSTFYKTSYLNERSTVLSLSLQLAFLGLTLPEGQKLECFI